MLKTLLPATLIALSALACSSSFADGPAPSTAPGAADFHFQRPLTAPTRLEVRDQNGPILVEPATGDTLEIVAVKTGKAENFARVQVVTREEGGTIVVCALWPGQDPSTCRPGTSPSGGHDDDTHVQVEFRLRVPSQVAVIDAHTMNGSIVARSAAGEVNLHTMNGSIDVTARGPITAETMNGAVVAHPTLGSAVQLGTKNGKVEVVLPPSSDADIEASTTNGRVTSEFGNVPAPAIRRLHDVKLRLGTGGTPISLHTLNGNVVVRRAAL